MRTILATCLIVVGLATAAAAAGPAVVIDGDTIVMFGERIRLLGIDTPESYRSRCEKELTLGLNAKARLRELLDAGPIRVERQGHDRYGRTLGRVLVGGHDVGETMLREKLALPYKPGTAYKLARLRAWCGPTAQLTDTWQH